MDWSGLLADLLAEIATKLNLFEDFTAFRGVCTSWRAAATKDKFVSVSKVPLLMLPEKDGDGDLREFYSLQKKKIFLRRPVPEAKGKRCIGAGFGWILTAPSSGEKLSLAKPLSSAKIQLPDMKTSPEDEYENYSAYQLESYDFVYPKKKRYFIKRAVLSANPSETSDYVVMVVVNRNLAGYWWRNGDNYWTKLELGPRNLADICYHKHKLYATDWQGKVWMWDRHLLSPEILVALPYVSWRNCLERAYLVESSKGELLLIARRRYLYLHGYNDRSYSTYFEIIKIDLEERKISVIGNLGRDAVFVGLNSAASVAADDFPGVVKGNHIYIAKDDSGDDFNQGKTMGIYNVEDESIEIIDVLPCFIYMCPPLWIFPSL